MKKTLFLLMFVGYAMFCHAEEKDTRTASERYEGAVYYGQTMCKLAIGIASDLAAMGKPQGESGDWRGCIKKHKADLKYSYEAFARTLKKSAAKAALKEHFILAATALNSIEPAPNELQLVYDKRQADLKAKVDEQWTRFEVEN